MTIEQAHEAYTAAYERATEADKAFSDALQATHGSAAGDERYRTTNDTARTASCRASFHAATADLTLALANFRAIAAQGHAIEGPEVNA